MLHVLQVLISPIALCEADTASERLLFTCMQMRSAHMDKWIQLDSKRCIEADVEESRISVEDRIIDVMPVRVKDHWQLLEDGDASAEDLV